MVSPPHSILCLWSLESNSVGVRFQIPHHCHRPCDDHNFFPGRKQPIKQAKSTYTVGEEISQYLLLIFPWVNRFMTWNSSAFAFQTINIHAHTSGLMEWICLIPNPVPPSPDGLTRQSSANHSQDGSGLVCHSPTWTAWQSAFGRSMSNRPVLTQNLKSSWKSENLGKADSWTSHNPLWHVMMSMFNWWPTIPRLCWLCGGH